MVLAYTIPVYSVLLNFKNKKNILGISVKVDHNAIRSKKYKTLEMLGPEHEFSIDMI